MFAVYFTRLVQTIGDTSRSDTNMARRCVGWASTAVTHLIWELDMADWLGSRTQLKHLCCSHSHITAGPNKMLGCRRAGQEVAQAQRHTFPFLASKDRSAALFHFSVQKCCRRMHKKRKMSQGCCCTRANPPDPAFRRSSAHIRL